MRNLIPYTLYLLCLWLTLRMRSGRLSPFCAEQLSNASLQTTGVASFLFDVADRQTEYAASFVGQAYTVIEAGTGYPEAMGI